MFAVRSLVEADEIGSPEVEALMKVDEIIAPTPKALKKRKHHSEPEDRMEDFDVPMIRNEPIRLTPTNIPHSQKNRSRTIWKRNTGKDSRRSRLKAETRHILLHLDDATEADQSSSSTDYEAYFEE